MVMQNWGSVPRRKKWGRPVLNRKSWVFGILFVVCGLIVGVLIATKLELPSISTSAEVAAPEPNFRLATTLPVVDTVANNTLPSHTFVRAAEQVIPKVVSISSTKIYYANPAGDDGTQQQNPPARFRAPQQLRQSGRGSGVILTADGYILTNVHVVDQAQKITVTLSDNRSFDAKIAGLDPLTEIAVIKINAQRLPEAVLGNSDKCAVGEWVLAIGNPLDLHSTVTAGIISAIGRQIDIIDDSYAVETFIQTDAAINPGNSGGALVNLRGEVIGINTAIATETGYDMGFGFAVPINLARRIALDLIRKGKVIRGYLGIAMQNVDELQARALKLGKPRGVFVDDVFPNSPAAREGLRPMDVILSIDGRPMNRVNQLQAYIADKSPGVTLRVKYFRDGSEFSRSVKLGDKEVDSRGRLQASVTPRKFEDLGIAVEELSQYDKAELGFTRKAGVLVTQVERLSPADDAGLREDDIITAVNRRYVNSPVEFRKAMKDIGPGDVVIVSIFRNQASHHLFIPAN